jgi:hypothetical protein
MRVARWLLLAALGFCGCRTLVDLNPRPPEAAPEGPRREGCDVREFPQATDVPEGSKSLGWMRVDRKEKDDDTYDALRKLICSKGGDAFSQLHWVKEPGVWEPTALEAMVWVLP